MPSLSLLHSQVAATLIKYRELKQLNQSEAADFLGTSVDIVRAYESGSRTYMEPGMVSGWLRDYEAPQYVIDEAKAQCRAIRFGDPSRWQNQGPEWLSRLARLELKATDFAVYEDIYVTGLCQTRACGQAIMDTNVFLTAEQKVQALDFRAYRRRTVLEARDGPRMRVIQAEQSLRVIEGTDFYDDQISRLDEDNEREHVELYVLPLGVLHASMEGRYRIMTFDDPATPDVVYHEGPLGGQYEATAKQVTRLRDVFSATLALAVPWDEWRSRC